MITSNLSDPQKAFNAKMEGIRKVIERAVHSPVPDITDHITEQIRDILKDSFIPKSESKTEDTYVKCIAEIPEISNKRDVTVGKIYKVIESDDISFKLYDDKGNHYWFHKDYFIPAEVKPAEKVFGLPEVKDDDNPPTVKSKRESFWHTVNRIQDEYKQENLKSIDIIFENLDKLNDRITELEKRLTELGKPEQPNLNKI